MKVYIGELNNGWNDEFPANVDILLVMNNNYLVDFLV